MLFSEIVRMALSSLGANKLRAALTMTGITIGVFSIISVMTAIGALQNSIESGISFLGSNIFQFAKYPVNIDAGGETKKKYQNRRNVTYRQALRYYELMQGNAQDICLMPITRFFENYGEANRTVNIATQPFSTELYNRTLDKGISAMRIARGLGANQENDFEIYTNDSLKSAFISVAGVVRIGAFVVSFIALVAAGIGIMNIMLVSVTERTKEIGVRKSIGARSRDILRQFLTEAVFISEAGGIVGIILGIIFGNLIAMWLQADMIFPYGWALAGLIVCSAIGIGFGAYPPCRAARLDPIDALRYE